ncbi:hypothetical protein [uncultured Endozoicomonas sp.]|uniref:hypothetical protein n=1 Tax=uncultured Endozoicomonas sp. TaxID=432652 RepID=UPI00262CB780|nr:hypothetical protein [uncultured Endozoicomonas sp.]
MDVNNVTPIPDQAQLHNTQYRSVRKETNNSGTFTNPKKVEPTSHLSFQTMKPTRGESIIFREVAHKNNGALSLKFKEALEDEFSTAAETILEDTELFADSIVIEAEQLNEPEGPSPDTRAIEDMITHTEQEDLRIQQAAEELSGDALNSAMSELMDEELSTSTQPHLADEQPTTSSAIQNNEHPVNFEATPSIVTLCNMLQHSTFSHDQIEIVHSVLNEQCRLFNNKHLGDLDEASRRAFVTERFSACDYPNMPKISDILSPLNSHHINAESVLTILLSYDYRLEYKLKNTPESSMTTSMGNRLQQPSSLITLSGMLQYSRINPSQLDYIHSVLEAECRLFKKCKLMELNAVDQRQFISQRFDVRNYSKPGNISKVLERERAQQVEPEYVVELFTEYKYKLEHAIQVWMKNNKTTSSDPLTLYRFGRCDLIPGRLNEAGRITEFKLGLGAPLYDSDYKTPANQFNGKGINATDRRVGTYEYIDYAHNKGQCGILEIELKSKTTVIDLTETSKIFTKEDLSKFRTAIENGYCHNTGVIYKTQNHKDNLGHPHHYYLIRDDKVIANLELYHPSMAAKAHYNFRPEHFEGFSLFPCMTQYPTSEKIPDCKSLGKRKVYSLRQSGGFKTKVYAYKVGILQPDLHRRCVTFGDYETRYCIKGVSNEQNYVEVRPAAPFNKKGDTYFDEPTFKDFHVQYGLRKR